MLISEFRAIQRRLGDDGDLNYFDRRFQMDQQRNTLLALLSSPLRELPQVCQSKDM